jgi:sugar O-acyltransferase (sialic acid O-acetyltransferase NeuD family)
MGRHVQPLLIVGAGGFGREAAEAVGAVNDDKPTYELLGFLDDNPDAAGTEVDGIPVLGPISSVADHPDAQVIVSTGHPGFYFSRKRIVERLGLPPDRYATLIHPLASVGRSVEVGGGTVLLAGAVATAGVRIGAHVAVMPGAVFTHDDVIGDYATFGSGARLAGRVTVGDGAYIGSGALIRQSLTVGAWALVGLGAVVLEDVPAAEVWVGVPARRLRKVELPADLVVAP